MSQMSLFDPPESQELTSSLEESLASPTLWQENDWETLTSARYGQKCFELYAQSAPLTWLWKTLLVSWEWHSTLRVLTWRAMATKQGRLYFQLAHKKRPISEIASLLSQRDARNEIYGEIGMWPTPTATMADGRSEQDLEVWKTRYERTKREKGIRNGMPLNVAVQMWPTPQSRDYRSGDLPDSLRAQRKKSQGWTANLNDVALWATPKASDGVFGKTARTSGRAIEKSTHLQTQIHLSTIDPEGTAQLNPEWVEVLLGIPAGWTDIDAPETEAERLRQPAPWPAYRGQQAYEWEPPRVARGVKNRVARLKALGNAIIPAQIAPIFAAIVAHEHHTAEEESQWTT